MPYAILRFQKRKAGSVAACERHNERKKEAYKSNPDIDMERSRENYHLVAPPRYTYKKEINRMTGAAGCRVRRDSVMLVETLITASPEFMHSLSPAEQRAYFAAALDFVSGRVGKQNIISAVVHMDETTLDKQHDEIVKALSDINAFNAGKKRDRALALLSAWLPDMERFSREIQKQSDYINSLKQRVNQSEQYADHLRDGRYAEELKVQEANKRIFELQRTNQQLERLVKLIPPEVLAELQKSGGDRPRGR